MTATSPGYLPTLPLVPLTTGSFNYIGCLANSLEGQSPFCNGLQSLNNVNMSIEWCHGYCKNFSAFGLDQGVNCKIPNSSNKQLWAAEGLSLYGAD